MKNSNTAKQGEHAPGPWHVGMNPGPIIYSPKGEQVADLRGNLLSADERRANIRLILAAPALLAVAKRIANFGEQTPQSRALTVANLQGIISEAHQAIEGTL